VIFGSEGFARVEGIGEKVVLGQSADFIELFVFDANMRVSVPLTRAYERGMRLISTTDELDAALESILAGRYQQIPWNRDGRLVKERYVDGDLESIIDTIGNLIEVAGTKKLNDAQRTLLDRARRALSLEVASAFGLDEDEATQRVDAVLDEATGARA
jgi:RNA polymerase-interacting CarD/CdnL/TRCF family regulator